MIYELGLRLGVTDFASASDAEAITSQLQHDLTDSTSNCILCLLRAHSKHEERDFFAPIRSFDADAIDLVLTEHREIQRRIYRLSKRCDEVRAAADVAHRIELGDQIHQEANDLFAVYLAHLNNEEAVLVPLMWERFTDAELRAMRAEFYGQVPLERFQEWMRWSLPAMNLHEQRLLLAGMRQDPPPNRYFAALEVAQRSLPGERWHALERALGPS